MGKAIIVGSGAGGSVMAMELAESGWDVVIFEMGPNYYSNLEGQGPFPTVFSNDELKSQYRYFEQPDPLAYPRTFRQTTSQNAATTYVGDVNDLPNQVGGAFPHSDVKVTRMWDIDFKGLSLLGPVPGADMADWPFEYSELAPYYDEIETLIGVQGDVASIPAFVQRHQPQLKPFPMPPGAQMRSSTLLAAGAKRLGLQPFYFPMAANSVEYNGSPACNNCGFCSGYGCPISAKPGNLIMLRRALHTGRVQLRPQTTVTQVNYTGRRATGVSFVDAAGNAGGESADVVVLACSAVLSPRLALLSNLPDPYNRIGKRIMFQNFYDGFAIFLNQRVHPYRGRSCTQVVFDFNDPDFRGARVFARLRGLPYIRAGLCELGGSQNPIAEGKFYQEILGFLPGVQFFGRPFKELMRASLLRDRLAGVDCFATDMPYLTNSVSLDPTVKDLNGQPAARITYKIGKFERVSQEFFIPLLSAMCGASGAQLYAAVPQSTANSIGGTAPPTGLHTMGGMQMGANPMTSVVDGDGRMHQMDNVFCSDSSVFATSGGSNPTNTIMAVALRTARGLTGRRNPVPSPIG
ncbi:GMC family oxidoreductase [Mycobacterium cookii]|uniref:2-keto-gluconate dehydrogenase n=1 Tax=Mycobacterium cookii TaxID=1775 RepID=A0A7I7KQS7_9MYCO|nr:GMC family oxidoreductase [Mycobacterium cookii]MCV7331977.1 GMC family oxidoreductase [Mycobacterium cookii]BBX44177.1 2-keto-gluconate dehydrogenase [Mycobacterium cookii]